MPDLFANAALAVETLGPQLRDYQRDVIARLEGQVTAGRRRLLLVAPTGAGKTIVASAIVADAVARGQAVLFWAHRRELIQQASKKLHASGIDHGIIQAGFPPREDAAVQVASIQTLHARAVRSARMELPPADLLIIDEAHHARAGTYQALVDAYPNAILLGMTATPCRGDGRGLGNIFEVIVECPSVEALIKAGHLVGTRVYAPSTPDLKGVKVKMGDYVESQLAARVDTDQLVGDIVSHWHRLAERRRTVVFATGVAHSVHIRNQFRDSGVVAEHIDGSTPADERDQILARLASGKVDIVTNCMVLTEGWDQPEVSCLILARPTKSIGLYRQMIGRVLRPAPGKVDALILDHSGAIFQHGFVEEPIEWTLSEDRKATNKTNNARLKDPKRAGLTTCPECKAIRQHGQPCSSCGWMPKPKAAPVDVIDGELSAVDRRRIAEAQLMSPAERLRWRAELHAIGVERGYKPGWASYKFKEKFGAWPPRGDPPFSAPSLEVRSWVKSRQIAWAKLQAAR